MDAKDLMDVLGAKISEYKATAESCDICGKSFQTGDLVYDCPTRQGPWGYHCPRCAILAYPKLGTCHRKE